jgi:hypothetical protein
MMMETRVHSVTNNLWYLLRRRDVTPNRRQSATISRASSILTQAPELGLGKDESHLRHPRSATTVSASGSRPHFMKLQHNFAWPPAIGIANSCMSHPTSSAEDTLNDS